MSNNSLTIVGFCGAAGSGKDEAARVLCQQYGFRKRSFAEALRHEVSGFLTQPDLRQSMWAEMPSAVRWAALRCLTERAFDPWAKPTAPAMRELLQLFGTEFRRAQDPDYWTKAEAAAMPKHGRIVYTDVRFPNELAVLRSRGALMFRVDRPGLPISDHASERNFPGFAVDDVLLNSGTREQFAALVDDRMCRWLPLPLGPEDYQARVLSREAARL